VPAFGAGELEGKLLKLSLFLRDGFSPEPSEKAVKGPEREEELNVLHYLFLEDQCLLVEE